MRILVYGDNHFSQYSSIIRKNGNKYSLRLENEIRSVNWAENLAENENCDMIVVLGDFFDSSNLNSMELTALHEIRWANMPHKFLVGNHELGLRNLQISSAHILSIIPNVEIIDKPKNEFDDINNIDICYLPYIFEDDRKSLSEYINDTDAHKLVFSHNDLRGIQLGTFISKLGFDIKDIQTNCDLFINGHLHNGKKVANKIINCGNLTGQNFGEDAFVYEHVALIIDTTTFPFQVAAYENPHAFNFYRLDFTKGYYDFSVKDNAVLSVVCNEDIVDELKYKFNNDSRIVEYKFTIHRNQSIITNDNDIVVTDHLKMFSDFILSKMENDDILLEELVEVCK